MSMIVSSRKHYASYEQRSTVVDGRGSRREANLRESALREDAARRRYHQQMVLGDNDGSHGKDLHQQTGLTAGTITHDDKLAADLGHLERKKISEVVGMNQLFGKIENNEDTESSRRIKVSLGRGWTVDGR